MKAPKRTEIALHALYYKLDSEIEWYIGLDIDFYDGKEMEQEVKDINEYVDAINSMRKLRGGRGFVKAVRQTKESLKDLMRVTE